MEKVESFQFDEQMNVLIVKTEKKICKIPVDQVCCKESEKDDFKKIMEEIGDNIAKIANKSGEMLNEKRKDILKGLRDWIDKELD